MDTSETLMETKCDDEGATATTTSDNHKMEVEIKINHPEQDDQHTYDCDHSGAACGPYSNCPCSVHSKTTVSDDEDQLLTDFLINSINSTDNIETQSLEDAVSQDTHTENNKTNGDISDNGVNSKHTNGDIGVNSNDNEECSPSLLDQRHCVKLYAEDRGPKLYPVNSRVVTEPIITKNLPEAFKFLPIFGMPKNSEELEQFQNAKVREYVGCDLSDEEFSKLASFCSPEHLKTGNELRMSTSYPRQEPLPEHITKSLEISELGQNLCLVKKLKLRKDKDTKHLYTKKLIYRGVKVIPLAQNVVKVSSSPLEPGKDLVFRVRVYRPFYCHGKDRHHTRHSIFTNDIVLLGRQKLTVLRDRLVCSNDEGMRVDMSRHPDVRPATSAKDVFPSGFLFINNAFYVDTREGCKDHSASIRQWARSRGLGDFPSYDMAQVTVDQLLVRLGHPEVYVHQGNCEHLFTFSEVRLLNSNDPLCQSVYPFHSAVAQHQTLYCTTCAEFGAKWIVIGCARVPFDPAFFCEICFKLYLYKNGEKVCDFKAYCYKGNLINLLKPV